MMKDKTCDGETDLGFNERVIIGLLITIPIGITIIITTKIIIPLSGPMYLCEWIICTLLTIGLLITMYIVECWIVLKLGNWI